MKNRRFKVDEKPKKTDKVASRNGQWLKVELFLNGEYSLININQIFSIRAYRNGTYINSVTGNSVFVSHTVEEIEKVLGIELQND